MSRQTLDKMIPLALEEIKIFDNGENKTESKYFSAIANIGVSVLQSGVNATQLFYKFKKNDKRENIPKIVSKIINDTKGLDKEFKEHNKKDILNACTALKLAIRVYKKIDNIDGD